MKFAGGPSHGLLTGFKSAASTIPIQSLNPKNTSVVWRQMNIVVIGAAGFIGSRVAQRFGQLGHQVLAMDCLDHVLYPASVKRARLRHLASSSEVRTAIVNGVEVDWMTALERVDLLVNLAAVPGLEPSWTHFRDYLTSNTLLVERLMQGLTYHPHVRLIHASTSSVYGRFAVRNEDANTKPASPYGLTKLAAENVINVFSSRSNLNATILRLYSVYGPGQRPDMAYARFIAQLSQGADVSIFGDGSQRRTNTYIDDVVDAFVRVASNSEISGTFNIGGGESFALLDSIRLIADLLNVEPRLNFEALRDGDQRETQCNFQRASEAFGWSPKTDFRTGIANQVRAFQDTQESEAPSTE